MSREKRIQEWLNASEGTLNTNTRPDGQGLRALEAISRWLSDRPEVPTVSLAWITPEAINVSFAEETKLGSPWRAGADSAEWIITADDALRLPAGPSYGRQMRALTGLGDTPDGCKVFYNLSRLTNIGANGTAELCQGFILGMVMEMAGQPWSEDHEIWLIGHGELGDKMINFLAPFHRKMFAAEKVSDVEHSALEGRSATLFVMGSSTDDLLAFNTISAMGTSMVTDTVLGNEVTLAIDIQSAATAQVVPLDYRIFPVMVTTEDEVFHAMESQWVARENLLQEFSDTEFTVNDFISTPEPGTGPVATNQRDIAAWCRQLTGYEEAETIQALAEAITANSKELTSGERIRVQEALQTALARADAEADTDTMLSVLTAQKALNEGGTL